MSPVYNIFRNISFLATLVALSACNTVKVPEINLPEFRDESANVGDYPLAANAPQAPTDIRSDVAWDNAAKELIAVRDGFSVPPQGMDSFQSDAEIEREIQTLTAKVKEYKLDDPPNLQD